MRQLVIPKVEHKRSTLDEHWTIDLIRADLFGPEWADLNNMRISEAYDLGQQMANDAAQDPKAIAHHSDGCHIGYHWRMMGITMQTTWNTLFPQTGA